MNITSSNARRAKEAIKLVRAKNNIESFENCEIRVFGLPIELFTKAEIIKVLGTAMKRSDTLLQLSKGLR